MLTVCNKEIDKLQSFIREARNENDGSWHPYEGQSIEKTLEQAEKTILKLRTLYQYDYSPNQRESKQQLEAVTKKIFKVTIREVDDEEMHIEIPMICTKRQRSDKYFRDSLDLQIGSYFTVPQMLKDRVIVFTYLYPAKATTAHHYVDYDNIETRAVMNVLSKFIIYDDDPQNCSVYYNSRAGDDKITIVSIFSPGRFIQWIQEGG